MSQSVLGYIVIIKRDGTEGSSFPVPVHEEKVVFGRDENCRVRVQNPSVSAKHSYISHNGKEAFLGNLSSTNTTRLNSQAITAETKISHGDMFTVGDRLFRFEYANKDSKDGSGSAPTPKKSILLEPNGAFAKAPPTPLASSTLSGKTILTTDAKASPLAKPAATPSATPRSAASKNLPTPVRAAIKAKQSEDLLSFSTPQPAKTLPAPMKPLIASAFKSLERDAENVEPIASSAPHTSAASATMPLAGQATPAKSAKSGPASSPKSAKSAKSVDEIASAGTAASPLVHVAVSAAGSAAVVSVDPLSAANPELPNAKPMTPLKVAEAPSSKLATPLRNDITKGTALRQLHKKMDTPIKVAIVKGVPLQKKSIGTVARMSTPIKNDLIRGAASLKQAIPMHPLPEPVRNEIENGGAAAQLKKTKAPLPKGLLTPVRQQLKEGVALKPKKIAPQTISTPLRAAIVAATSGDGITLKSIKPTARLATPIKRDITKGKESLKPAFEVHKLNTPVREAIKKGAHQLRPKAALPSLPAELKSEIESGAAKKSLKPVHKSAPEDLLEDIKRGVVLRPRNKPPKLDTPLRQQIQSDAQLNQVYKKAANTPVRAAIAEAGGIKALKPKSVGAVAKLATPVKAAIAEAGGAKTLKPKSVGVVAKLATPVKAEIVSGAAQLRKKEIIPAERKVGTPLRASIRQGVALKPVQLPVLQPTPASVPTPTSVLLTPPLDGDDSAATDPAPLSNTDVAATEPAAKETKGKRGRKPKTAAAADSVFAAATAAAASAVAAAQAAAPDTVQVPEVTAPAKPGRKSVKRTAAVSDEPKEDKKQAATAPEPPAVAVPITKKARVSSRSAKATEEPVPVAAPVVAELPRSAEQPAPTAVRRGRKPAATPEPVSVAPEPMVEASSSRGRRSAKEAAPAASTRAKRTTSVALDAPEETKPAAAPAPAKNAGKAAAVAVVAPAEDACKVCHGSDDEDKLLLCDSCDAMYHLYCLKPALKAIPKSDWFCSDCRTAKATKAAKAAPEPEAPIAAPVVKRARKEETKAAAAKEAEMEAEQPKRAATRGKAAASSPLAAVAAPMVVEKPATRSTRSTARK